ncbi:hypothetical protein N7504_003215 [Penicillium tannophilum]|nr:hypothetical protein N7504_003215 [Penicillium tannophilum]
MASYECLEDMVGIEELKSAEPFTIDLFENTNSEITQKQGKLNSYSTLPGGSAIFASSKSGHSISVEKLLWADGWEGTQNAENRGKEMTLVVLKAIFSSRDPDTRIRYARMTLVFDRPKDLPSASEPLVEAWSPFNQIEYGNRTTVQKKHTHSLNVNATAGYAGSSVAAGGSKDKEISWEQTHFDEGWSDELFSDESQRRNGISWIMKQNDFENRGVERELWVAVLISRSKDPYVVRFNVEVHTTTRQRYMEKLATVFGSKPGETKPFRITPGHTPVINSQGRDILKSVDLDNLRKIRDANDETKLRIKLGPERPSTEPVTSVEEFKPETHSRLVQLETRMAQLEARLATQDSTILGLQRELMEQAHKAPLL